MNEISPEKIQKYYHQLLTEAEKTGYHLNSDLDLTLELVKSLLTNEERYGYQSCPCRWASGLKEEDRDIVCPCDYRDQDLAEYGRCYCALYVSAKATKENLSQPIPERRPSKEERKKKAEKEISHPSSLSLPVWRCQVCGYLCARQEPPEVCPICKATKDRFERFY